MITLTREPATSIKFQGQDPATGDQLEYTLTRAPDGSATTLSLTRTNSGGTAGAGSIILPGDYVDVRGQLSQIVNSL